MSLKTLLLSYRPLRKLLLRARNAVNYLSGKPEGRGVILMLHRVCDWEAGKLFQNENMKVSPGRLEAFILSHRDEYDFIRLEDVPARLQNPQQKKFMVFTMDDGYKDNLTEALPVFRKHKVPFTIFITTDFPDKQALLWWYMLENLLLSHDCITLTNGTTYPAHTLQEKTESFTRLRNLVLSLNQENLQEEIGCLFKSYPIDWKALCDQLCLSWEDIEELKHEPLVTLGAHTQRHRNLKQLSSPEAVKQEVMNGWHRLEQKAHLRASVFAYPFGSANEAGPREFQTLSELSDTFRLAVIAHGGLVSARSALYALERIMLTETFDEDALRFSKNAFNRK